MAAPQTRSMFMLASKASATMLRMSAGVVSVWKTLKGMMLAPVQQSGLQAHAWLNEETKRKGTGH